MTTPLVHGIDHVYVPFVDAEAVFRLLTEAVGLPVAWPYMAHGEFASGGVNFGNVNFEVLATSEAVPTFRAASPARVQGIAFHPVPTPDLVAGLDHRRLPHGSPVVFPPGSLPATGAMWTNTVLESLSHETLTVFGCEYHVADVYDYGARRAVLEACGGGALGLIEVGELVIGSRDVAEAREHWQRFFDPIVPTPQGCWEFEHGPTLRLEDGDIDAVQEVVLVVRSVAEAGTVIQRLTASLNGLSLRFVDA